MKYEKKIKKNSSRCNATEKKIIGAKKNKKILFFFKFQFSQEK